MFILLLMTFLQFSPVADTYMKHVCCVMNRCVHFCWVWIGLLCWNRWVIVYMLVWLRTEVVWHHWMGNSFFCWIYLVVEALSRAQITQSHTRMCTWVLPLACLNALCVYFLVFIFQTCSSELWSNLASVWESVYMLISGFFFSISIQKACRLYPEEEVLLPLFFRGVPQWWCDLAIIYVGLQWHIELANLWVRLDLSFF